MPAGKEPANPKMIKLLLLLCSLNLFLVCTAQTRITFHVSDSINQALIAGASVINETTKEGTITDTAGRAGFVLFSPAVFTVHAVGYGTQTIAVDTGTFTLEVMLQKAVENLDEVIVSSSRTDSRIENLPTRVEVLGMEEVDEESGIKPSNIASLLGDVAGIQTQQTSAVTGSTELRVQGLPGNYTQLLRDGMPLFGDFAGSFSILQIPPLDLRQIEIIKGASSIVYGGGAIAGIINLISKKPTLGTFEKTVLLNYSTLNEANVNMYLSNRNQKLGYTFFTGVTHQKAADVNGDGFSDVAAQKSVFLHPQLFFYPNAKNTISLGYNAVFENRNGGDMHVLKTGKDGLHQFFIKNKLARNTADLQWQYNISPSQKFVLKAIGSWLDRTVATPAFGMMASQFSHYSEASYIIKHLKHDIVAGTNFNGENFKKAMPDSTAIPNYTYTTVGLFVQDDWRLHPKLTLETGLRTDVHSRFGTFILPRISLLYKIAPALATRLGGGLGYKIPTVFDSEIDERDYPKILPMEDAKAERSYGANWDFNFYKKLCDVSLTINQSFYITQLKDPVIISTTPNAVLFTNAAKGIQTKGLETYVQLSYGNAELYLGYTLTDALRQYNVLQPHVALSAKNKFASVVAYEFSDRFRAGIEAAVTGSQYLDDGTKTPAFLFAATMLRYDIKNIALVLNCENLFDYRQSRRETLFSGPVSNPVFRQLWAPIDGRVINLSVRLKL